MFYGFKLYFYNIIRFKKYISEKGRLVVLHGLATIDASEQRTGGFGWAAAAGGAARACIRPPGNREKCRPDSLAPPALVTDGKSHG